MSNHTPFSTLRDEMPPESQARAAEKASALERSEAMETLLSPLDWRDSAHGTSIAVSPVGQYEVSSEGEGYAAALNGFFESEIFEDAEAAKAWCREDQKRSVLAAIRPEAVEALLETFKV